MFVRFLCERPRRGPERPVYTQLCSHAWGERGGHISRRREARWGPRTSSTYGRHSCTCSACAFFSPFFFTFAVLLLALRSSQAVGICGRYREARGWRPSRQPTHMPGERLSAQRVSYNHRQLGAAGGGHSAACGSSGGRAVPDLVDISGGARATSLGGQHTARIARLHRCVSLPPLFNAPVQ